MFSRTSRATALGFIAVALAVLAAGCSNDHPITPAPPNTDVTTPIAAGGLASDPSPPAEGIVVEGVSVPGIALGSTRAEVEEAYGEATECGDTGRSCGWDVPGGGAVHVNFQGPHGGEASDSPDDVVVSVHWSEPVDGWTTTAGVNTTLADEDPEALVAAYPNARVTRNLWGGVVSVVDYSLGIRFRRDWILYSSGEVLVTGSIFYPREPPPLPEEITCVHNIDLLANKVKGKRQARAWVGVRDQTHFAASDATVSVRWTFPDGSTQAAESVTSGSGNAYFEINDIPRGSYTLTVEDVVLEDHRFDSDNSLLSASVNAK